MEPKETITVPREHARQVSEYADFVRAGALRDPDSGPALAAEMSYYGTRHVPRAYMHPEVAIRFGQKYGPKFLGARGRLAMARLRLGQQFNQPQTADIHVDTVLTAVSIAYRNQELIGRSIFPTVQV